MSTISKFVSTGVLVMMVAALWKVVAPMIESAVHRGRALATMQRMHQVAEAVSFIAAQGDAPPRGRESLHVLVQRGYLKAVPDNAVAPEGGTPILLVVSADVGDASRAADMVMAGLGQDRVACDIMQGSGTAIPALLDDAGRDVRLILSRSSGCFRMNHYGLDGRPGPGDYVAFVLF